MQPEPAMPGFNWSASGNLRVVVNVNSWAVNKIPIVGCYVDVMYVHEMVPSWISGDMMPMIHDPYIYQPVSIEIALLFWMNSISNSLCFQVFAESLSLRCLGKKLTPIPDLLLFEYLNQWWGVVHGKWHEFLRLVFSMTRFGNRLNRCRWNEVVRVVVGMSSSIDVFYWRILRCTWTCEEWLLSWEHVPYGNFSNSFPGE